MIEVAMKLLDVKKDELNKFSTIDTFNNNNKLEGFICRKSDHRYGALVILSINDIPTEQVIWATPKLEYPFNRNGVFDWPEVMLFQFYEKLDGTNILAYKYVFENKTYLTFKTRLTAVVLDSGFSDFRSMWVEYMTNNSWIMEVIEDNPDYNLSFELYGQRNPITINYPCLLEVSLLFGVKREDSKLTPVRDLKLSVNTKIPWCYSSTEKTDLTELYNNLRGVMSDKNKETLTIEGMVMYAYTNELKWRMFKCKPEEIERIHWSASGIIPSLSLMTTAMNVFESNENPTIDDYKKLLDEEYPEELLTKNSHKINKIWVQATEKINVIKKVNEVYKLALEKGFDVKKDKVATMRFVSQFFSKNVMGRVGTIILKQAGLL